MNKINKAKDLGRFIQGKDLFAYISNYFQKKYQGSRLVPIDEDQLIFKFELSTEAKVEVKEFIKQHALYGSTESVTDRPLPLLFDNQLSSSSKKFEHINQDHTLVKFVTQKMNESSSESFPVSAVQVSLNHLVDIKRGIYIYSIQRWSFKGAVTQEFLKYQIYDFQQGQLLDMDQSEYLVNIAALHGTDWLGASTEMNGEVIADLFDESRNTLDDAFKKMSIETESENKDRSQTMINLIEQRREDQIRKHRENIQNWRNSGYQEGKKITLEGQIKMEEGKIKKQRERSEEKIAELRKKQTLIPDNKFVIGGVIKVY